MTSISVLASKFLVRASEAFEVTHIFVSVSDTKVHGMENGRTYLHLVACGICAQLCARLRGHLYLRKQTMPDSIPYLDCHLYLCLFRWTIDLSLHVFVPPLGPGAWYHRFMNTCSRFSRNRTVNNRTVNNRTDFL